MCVRLARIYTFFANVKLMAKHTPTDTIRLAQSHSQPHWHGKKVFLLSIEINATHTREPTEE